MPKTYDFLTSTFSRSCIDFGGSWASNLEQNWPSWTPRALPRASKIQSFGGMCPRCLSRGSKKPPKEPQTSIFGGFSMDLGTFFRHFRLVKLILLTKTPSIICTGWVTPSLEKYILTDFKPHVQLAFKCKMSSILRGANSMPKQKTTSKSKNWFWT